MSETFNHIWQIASGLLGAIILAFIGGMTRLTHEHVQNVNKFSWNRVAFSLPSAVLMGVIGGSLGSYLQNAYSFPESVAWALAGALGYLGPTFINSGARVAVGYFQKGKRDGD